MPAAPPPSSNGATGLGAALRIITPNCVCCLLSRGLVSAAFVRCLLLP